VDVEVEVVVDLDLKEEDEVVAASNQTIIPRHLI
jgi:hypothetical protein